MIRYNKIIKETGMVMIIFDNMLYSRWSNDDVYISLKPLTKKLIKNVQHTPFPNLLTKFIPDGMTLLLHPSTKQPLGRNQW